MMMSSWIHDDITWCAETDCPNTECERNTVNMMERSGLHSYAMFRGTEYCPMSRRVTDCVSVCKHMQECLSRHNGWDDAYAELTEDCCEKCPFSEWEED